MNSITDLLRPADEPASTVVWACRSAVVQDWIAGRLGSEAFGSLRCVITRANGQPAVAGNVSTGGDAAHGPRAIDVMRMRDEIITFDRVVFKHFDLPATLGVTVGTR
jgi:hypothetical protein